MMFVVITFVESLICPLNTFVIKNEIVDLLRMLTKNSQLDSIFITTVLETQFIYIVGCSFISSL